MLHEQCHTSIGTLNGVIFAALKAKKLRTFLQKKPSPPNFFSPNLASSYHLPTATASGHSLCLHLIPFPSGNQEQQLSQIELDFQSETLDLDLDLDLPSPFFFEADDADSGEALFQRPNDADADDIELNWILTIPPSNWISMIWDLGVIEGVRRQRWLWTAKAAHSEAMAVGTLEEEGKVEGGERWRMGG